MSLWIDDAMGRGSIGHRSAKRGPDELLQEGMKAADVLLVHLHRWYRYQPVDTSIHESKVGDEHAPSSRPPSQRSQA
jgi:hypothetical protein